MAKDQENEDDHAPNQMIPFSPIFGPSDSRRQTTCLTRPLSIRENRQGHGRLSTSTPYRRRSLPLALESSLDEVDGCSLQTAGLRFHNNSLDDSIHSSSTGSLNSPDICPIPKFTFEELVKADSEAKKDVVPINYDMVSVHLDMNTTDKSSSNDEFKKPTSSPLGRRKRLPVATVTQLHKDTLREQRNMQCYWHRDVVKTESFADISNISIKSSTPHDSKDLSLHSNTDHDDSGYLTFNSTALSVSQSSQIEISASSDVALGDKLDIPLPRNTIFSQISFEENLDKHSPSYRTFSHSVIGKKFGLENVDIITELSHKGALPCLRLIFEMLEVRDLKCMCAVSQSWKRVCLDDSRVKQRLKEDKANSKDKLFTLGKENLQRLKQRANAGLTTTLVPRKHALAFNQNKDNVPITPSVCISPTKLLARSDQYIHAASKLKNEESLDKCPRCLFPAKVHKVQERGCCTKERCKFDYCIKCRMGFHGSKPCGMTENSRAKVGGVGTKKSKKNLRRL